MGRVRLYPPAASVVAGGTGVPTASTDAFSIGELSSDAITCPDTVKVGSASRAKSWSVVLSVSTTTPGATADA